MAQLDSIADVMEIPAFTAVSLSTNKIKHINVKKYAGKRVMQLFISHLLDDDAVTKHETIEKHFVFKDMVFKNIMIRGTVVGVQFRRFPSRDRMILNIDDGTGVMDCYVEDNTCLEDIRRDTAQEYENVKAMFDVENSDILKATLMMFQSINQKLKRLPHFKDFQLGDTVCKLELIGTLSEYHDKRSCFIGSIVKVNTNGNACYLENLDALYKTHYFKN